MINPNLCKNNLIIKQLENETFFITKYLTKPTANYKLVFKAKSVDGDGETTGQLLLVDMNDKVVGIADPFHARGGRFGSQMNLMGDAAERLGKKVAKFINKVMK